MTDRIYSHQSSPSTDFWLEADLLSQNLGANTSVVRVYLRAANGGNTSSYYGGSGSQTAYVNGAWVGAHSGSPFLPSGVGNGVQRWRNGPFDATVTHNAAGYATVTLAMGLVYGSINTTPSTTLTLPRIRKPASAPGTPSIGTLTSSSAALSWTAPGDDGGASITGYTVQFATNSAFTTGVGTQDFGGTSGTVTALAPGQSYWFRVRANNAAGAGAWSGSSTAFIGLPAPTLNSWAQNSTGGLVASWSAPSTTTGLTGYRVQVARDANFTTGIVNTDFGNVLTGTVTGLAGGRQYYARVAALTPGGVNAYSNALSTMLVLDAGDLDGWTRVGTKPAAISYYTAEGLRRGVTGTSSALWLESLSTGSVTLAADTYGIQRTMTGLTVGKAYRFEASGTLDGTPLADTYRLRVVSESDAAPVTLSTAPASLGYVEFVADATSVVVQILLAEEVIVTGAQDSVERAAFHTLRLLEMATDYPVRLRETVYESNLANHFDLACSSVGASWYVDASGVAQFRLPGAALPTSAVFTDEVNDAALHYVDISASRDTRGMFNRLDVTNYGVDEERVNEQNDDLVVLSSASIDKYGVRSARLETNLYGESPYDESLGDRLTALLDENDEPQFLMSQLRWNAQEDLTQAAALEVGQRVTVRRKGFEQDSQIVAIKHDVQPERWMVTLDLRKVGT